MPNSSEPPDSSNTWQLIQQLFEQALELPESDRQAFLQHSTQSAETIKEVSEMLAAHHGAPLELEKQAELLTQGEKTPDRFGPYKIIRELGRGGMSVVYLANRDDNTFNRQVAIKTLDQIILSKAMQNRFRHEQRIHARLNHPNIARLMDAGVTAENKPYFVMQYVDGVSIIEYANSQKSTIKQRLNLVTQVCDAITFAHSQLILHRDIKPSNILVNNQGQVLLLDFGIAKLLDDDHDDVARQDLTREGDKLMTLSYASPEQIRGEVLTTASDVFSLGVLFFELLTGHRPFQGNNDFELSNAIINQAAAPPLKTAAGLGISRDLQAIALKAIEKQPHERYLSVAAMADDIRRYLNHEVISARPPSLFKKLTQFWRRNPIAAPLGTIAMTGIIVSLALALWQAQRAEKQRLIANEERDRSEQVADLMLDLFDVDPFADDESRRDDITLREFLTSRVQNMELELSDQPALQAKLFTLFANLYSNLGHLEQAEALTIKALTYQQKTLGNRHAEVATSLNTLATIKQYQARYDEAEQLFREALSIRSELLPESDPDLASSINNLSNLLYERDRDDDFAEIVALDERSLKIREQQFGKNSLQVAESLNGLASTKLLSENKQDQLQAEKMYRRALAIRQNQLGNDHANTANTMSNLANLLHDMNQLKESEQLFLQAIDIAERVLGKNHPRLTAALYGLGKLYQDQARWNEASAVIQRSLDLNQKSLPAEHPFIMSDLLALVAINFNNDKLSQAQLWLKQAQSIKTEDPEASSEILNWQNLLNKAVN